MRQIETSLEIAAPIDRVWRTLTRFDEFPLWNPFMTSISGTLVKGGKLIVRMEPPGGKAMTFRPTVTRLDPGRGFAWLGHLLIPGLFDGEHVFELEERGGSATKLVQREEFGGVLAGPILNSVGDNTRRGFVAMNEALKARVEQSLVVKRPPRE